MKTLVLPICALALASVACNGNEAPSVPSSLQSNSPSQTATGESTTDQRFEAAAKAPRVLHTSIECVAGGQTTATWENLQLHAVEIRWYDGSGGVLNATTFDVKRRPFGSVSAPTASGAITAEAFFEHGSVTVTETDSCQ